MLFLKTRCDVQFLWGRFLFYQHVPNGLTEPPLSQGHTHREPWFWYIPRPQGILSNPKDDLNLHWSHDWNKPVWLVWARQDKIYIKIWCCRAISKIGHTKIWFHRDSEADVMLFLANYIDSTFLCPVDFGTVSRALVDVKPTSIYTSTSTWLCTGVFRDALCFQRDKWGRCLGDGFKDAWCSHLV